MTKKKFFLNLNYSNFSLHKIKKGSDIDDYSLVTSKRRTN